MYFLHQYLKPINKLKMNRFLIKKRRLNKNAKLK